MFYETTGLVSIAFLIPWFQLNWAYMPTFTLFFVCVLERGRRVQNLQVNTEPSYPYCPHQLYSLRCEGTEKWGGYQKWQAHLIGMAAFFIFFPPPNAKQRPQGFLTGGVLPVWQTRWPSIRWLKLEGSMTDSVASVLKDELDFWQLCSQKAVGTTSPGIS